MKKLVPVLLIALLALAACAKNYIPGNAINVNVKTQEAPTVSGSDEGKNVFFYQGVVELGISGAGEVGRITVKDIKFAENNNNKAVMLKYSKKYLEPNDIIRIEQGIKRGEKYDSYSFEPGELIKRDNTYYVGLQYIMTGVSPSVKKEDLKRRVDMSVEIQSPDGKIVGTKKVEIDVP